MSQKTRWLHVRCSPEDHRAVKRLAGQRGVNISEAVRRAVRAEAKRAGVRVKGGRRDDAD